MRVACMSKQAVQDLGFITPDALYEHLMELRAKHYFANEPVEFFCPVFRMLDQMLKQFGKSLVVHLDSPFSPDVQRGHAIYCGHSIGTAAC